MALCAKVLRKKASKFELKESVKYRVTAQCASALEELFHDVLATCRPKPSDYSNRRDLVRVFNKIAKEIYGLSGGFPVIEEFGSFLMDIFSTASDLDLSVNFGCDAVEFPREKKIQTLRKFAKKFYALQRNGHVSGVLPVMTAKVPILKVVDMGTGIECDLSVENRDGILKSRIVHMISSIDGRFTKLSFLMKAWARAHNINCSKDRTLNSLSLVLLVAFHLQTRNPPILPPFSVLLKDGCDAATVSKLTHQFAHHGKRNKESLGELFVSQLIKLSSVEKLWPKGLCASAYEGSWISKTWDGKIGHMSVEDFTDRSQNVARAVGTREVKVICNCIQLALQHVFAFMKGQIGGRRLVELLFGLQAIPPPPLNMGTPNFDTDAAYHRVQRKRMHPEEILGGTPQERTFDHPTVAKRMRTIEGSGGMPLQKAIGE